GVSPRGASGVCVRTGMGIRQPTWHVRCLIPSSRDCPANPGYAFGLLAAGITPSRLTPAALAFRRLAVRAGVSRRAVGATLGAADDLGQILLVERPQGLLGQGELLFLHGPPSLSGCRSDRRAPVDVRAALRTAILL